MTSPRRPTQMQEKAAAVKRQHVLDAALTVFAGKGFRGATIHDVAQAAGVADGTIYNLFENKTALLHGILSAQPDDEFEVGHNGFGSVAALPLRTLLCARWAALDASKLAMLRVVLAEALVDPEFRVLYRTTLLTPAIVQLEPALAIITGPASAALDARLITGLFLGLVMLRLFDDPMLEDRNDDIADRLADFVASGLAPASAKVVGP